jgi:hypothetical protein
MKSTNLTRAEFVRQVEAGRLKMSEMQGKGGYDLNGAGLSELKKFKSARKK